MRQHPPPQLARRHANGLQRAQETPQAFLFLLHGRLQIGQLLAGAGRVLRGQPAIHIELHLDTGQSLRHAVVELAHNAVALLVDRPGDEAADGQQVGQHRLQVLNQICQVLQLRRNGLAGGGVEKEQPAARNRADCQQRAGGELLQEASRHFDALRAPRAEHRQPVRFAPAPLQSLGEEAAGFCVEQELAHVARRPLGFRELAPTLGLAKIPQVDPVGFWIPVGKQRPRGSEPVANRRQPTPPQLRPARVQAQQSGEVVGHRTALDVPPLPLRHGPHQRARGQQAGHHQPVLPRQGDQQGNPVLGEGGSPCDANVEDAYQQTQSRRRPPAPPQPGHQSEVHKEQQEGCGELRRQRQHHQQRSRVARQRRQPPAPPAQLLPEKQDYDGKQEVNAEGEAHQRIERSALGRSQEVGKPQGGCQHQPCQGFDPLDGQYRGNHAGVSRPIKSAVFY